MDKRPVEPRNATGLGVDNFHVPFGQSEPRLRYDGNEIIIYSHPVGS